METNYYEMAYSYIDYIQSIIGKLIVRYNLCRSDIEDLSHEVVFKVAKGLSSFEERAKVETWIHRITTNHVLTYMRKYAKMHYYQSVDLNDIDNYEQVYRNSFYLTPEFLYLKKENYHYLLFLIGKLNDKQKSALLLFVNEEKSYKEIASIMDITETSVKSLIFRAREKLKKQIVA